MKAYKRILYGQLILILNLLIFLLWAFPVKWAWNYTMPYIFNLPIINWGHAFVLLFIMKTLWRSTEIIER